MHRDASMPAMETPCMAVPGAARWPADVLGDTAPSALSASMKHMLQTVKACVHSTERPAVSPAVQCRKPADGSFLFICINLTSIFKVPFFFLMKSFLWGLNHKWLQVCSDYSVLTMSVEQMEWMCPCGPSMPTPWCKLVRIHLALRRIASVPVCHSYVPHKGDVTQLGVCGCSLSQQLRTKGGRSCWFPRKHALGQQILSNCTSACTSVV